MINDSPHALVVPRREHRGHPGLRHLRALQIPGDPLGISRGLGDGRKTSVNTSCQELRGSHFIHITGYKLPYTGQNFAPTDIVRFHLHKITETSFKHGLIWFLATAE